MQVPHGRGELAAARQGASPRRGRSEAAPMPVPSIPRLLSADMPHQIRKYGSFDDSLMNTLMIASIVSLKLPIVFKMELLMTLLSPGETHRIAGPKLSRVFKMELATDGGFAFGGVFPGTLHAHGLLREFHRVSYSIGQVSGIAPE